MKSELAELRAQEHMAAEIKALKGQVKHSSSKSV